MAKANSLQRLKVREISSVDRGAGEDVNVVLFKAASTDEQIDAYLKRNLLAEIEKRDISQGEREKAVAEGNAMPDGSYPIENAQDLHNAIQAFGRGGSKKGLRGYIIRRARALGLADKIPPNWSRSKKKLYKIAETLGVVRDLMKDTVSFEDLLAKMSSTDADGGIEVVKDACNALKRSIESIVGCEDLTPEGCSKAIAESYSQFTDHLAGVAPDSLTEAMKGAIPMPKNLKEKLLKAYTSVGTGTAKEPPVKGAMAAGSAEDPAKDTGINDKDTAADRMSKMEKVVDKAIAKAIAPLEERIKLWQGRTHAALNLSKAAKDYLNHDDNDMDDEDKNKFLDASPADRAKMMEANPVATMTEKRMASLPEPVRKQLADAKDTSERLAKREEADELMSFGKRATEVGQTEEFGKALRTLAKGLGTEEERTKAFDEVMTALTAATNQAKAAGLFKELGNSQNRAGTAYEQLMVKAEEIRSAVNKTATGAPMTIEQAFTKVYEDSANRELVAQHKAETRARAA